MRDQMTLTERVERVEQILSLSGFGGSIGPIARDEEQAQRAFDERVSGRLGEDKIDRWDDERYNTKMNDAVEAIRNGDITDRRAKQAGENEPFVRVTSFEEIMNRIQGCNERVCATADKLGAIGDRILGALPETDSDAIGPQRPPDGTLEHTFMALNWLDQSLSRLETAAVRMERI